MKFSCENCQAQYMISDEKVGPSGVRVRCKKCQHINLIKPLAYGGAAEAAPQSSGAGASAASGVTGSGSSPGLKLPKDLEEEIGNALDSVFADTPAPASTTSPFGNSSEVGGVVLGGSVSGSTPIPEPQPTAGGETQPKLRSSQPGATGAPSPAATAQVATTAANTEWYVAISDEQVGPLRAEDVKARWDRGEIGADTLVWCGRMPDWRPLSSVEDLAQLVVPISPRSQPTPTPRIVGALRTPAPVDDEDPAASFKPSAASALASLASMAKEEISSADRVARKDSQPVRVSPAAGGLLGDLSNAPEPERAPRAPRIQEPRDTDDLGPSAARRESSEGTPASVGGGPRWSTVILSAMLVALLVAAAAYWFVLKPKQELSAERATQASTSLARTEIPAVPPPPVAPANPATPTPVAEPALAAPSPPTPTPTSAPTPPPTSTGPATPPAATTHAPASKAAAAVAAEDRRHRRDRAHAAGPGERSRPIASANPGGSSGEDFLNGAGESSLDKEFAKELEGEGASRATPKRSVYIPPPPGQSELPQVLSQSDILETVVQHKGSFAKCVQEQKRRDPGSTGTLVMRWKIRPDGRTAEVVSKGGDYQDSPLAGCLKAQISRLHFGGYRGPQMAPIDFPFNF
jgi:predicted Zn finger-like uncharacterized protein